MEEKKAPDVVGKKPKVVFVLGATATGKSKLAISIAKRFDGEVINADKIQVHDGVPIITNKVTEEERAGVPHHLLGGLPPDAEFTAEDFRREAAGAVASVLSAGRLPVVAGGSNTYIEALVEGRDAAFRRAHDVLFLWVDVAAPELMERYAARRVDNMVARGLVDEARAAFGDAGGADDYTRGVRRAIGLPEMHAYLLAEREGEAEAELADLLACAVREIKDNTFALARAQVAKIRRLCTLDGWDVRRVDATPVFACMAEEEEGGAAAAACDNKEKMWEAVVWEPCQEMVKRFLDLETTPAAAPTTDTVDCNAGGSDDDGEPTGLAVGTDGNGGAGDEDIVASVVAAAAVGSEDKAGASGDGNASIVNVVVTTAMISIS